MATQTTGSFGPRIGELALVFRRYGYQGATTKLLSDASQLGKSSLYHHFPRGKEDMALAVVSRTREVLFKELLAPLAPGISAASVARFTEGLYHFYENGQLGCIVATLSLGEAPASVQEAVTELLDLWIDFIHALLEPAPRETAVRVVSTIQGGLLLAIAGKKPDYLEGALNDVKGMLLQHAG